MGLIAKRPGHSWLVQSDLSEADLKSTVQEASASRRLGLRADWRPYAAPSGGVFDDGDAADLWSASVLLGSKLAPESVEMDLFIRGEDSGSMELRIHLRSRAPKAGQTGDIFAKHVAKAISKRDPGAIKSGF